MEVFDVEDGTYPKGTVGLQADSTEAWFDKVSVNNVLTHQSSSDNLVTQWQPLGLYMAEDVWGIVAPGFVRDELRVWLEYSHGYDGGFGYDRPDGSNVLRAGSGISSAIYMGVTP